MGGTRGQGHVNGEFDGTSPWPSHSNKVNCCQHGIGRPRLISSRINSVNEEMEHPN